MSNNLFYKTLSVIGTLGIVVLSATQVSTAFKKGNNAEDQLAKTISEIKNARKDALSQIRKDTNKALNEVRDARKDILKSLKKESTGKQDSFYLIFRDYSDASGVVPMDSLSACEIAGATLQNTGRFVNHPTSVKFECLEGQ